MPYTVHITITDSYDEDDTILDVVLKALGPAQVKATLKKAVESFEEAI